MLLKKKLFAILLLSFFLFISMVGCTSKKAIKPLTPDERFEKISQLFSKNKYDKVIEESEVYLVAFSGTKKVDSVQYLLAESHFQLKQFILAQAEYERLADQFPSSSLVEISRYKSALSFYNLSPKSQLDQNYTIRAYDLFQQYLDEFPASSNASNVEEIIQDCREKLAKKELETADLYFKMRKYDSALLYYNLIIDDYYLTKSEPFAYFGKGRVFEILQEENAAKLVYELILKKFEGSHAAVLAGKRIKDLYKK